MEESEKHNTNTPPPPRKGFVSRHTTTLKIIVVGILTLLLLIPLSMISSLIYERLDTKRNAELEITSKWSGEQIITGPCIVIPYTQEIKQKDKQELVRKNLLLLPNEMNVTVDAKVEKRKRGIYDVSLYSSELLLTGTLNMDEIAKTGIKPEDMQLNQARVIMGISDLKGIREGVVMQLGAQNYDFEPGIPVENLYTDTDPIAGKSFYERDLQVTSPNLSTGIFSAGLNVKIDSIAMKDLAQGTLPFTINLYLNGSQGLFIVPIGKTTTAKVESDWPTPSFGGDFLPANHNVTDEGFTANWKIIDLNRSFGQTVNAENATAINQMATSAFGVKFIQSVDQYQQNERSAKYAILIILLTFVVVFFIEVLKKKAVNPFQYLLIGLALVLFYSLLLSLSEIWGFNLAYIVAAVMTTVLIVVHMSSILKNRNLGLFIGALLTFLYLFVFILIQMESYALLVGSIGLFCILAVIMYFSKKLEL
jgi:inner membrane protein